MRHLKAVIILLSLIFCLHGCAESRTNQNTDTLPHLLDDYSKAIVNGIPDDMLLTIYYLESSVLTLKPVNETELIEWYAETEDVHKVVVDSTELSSRIDQLRKIDSCVIQTAHEKETKDARIYYYVELKTTGKVLEVTMRGSEGNIFVNGIEVKYNPVFFELVSPYLTFSTD